MSSRLARVALSLYPISYRRRYGEEIEALLDATRPGPLTVVDLVRGALVAHLRPPRGLEEYVDPGARIRASTSGVLVAWVAFAAAGFGFYKTTEDAPFSAAGNAHPLLDGAHVAVQLLAMAGSAAVVLGAAPLIWVALTAAWRERRLRALVILPPAAVLVFFALTAALAIAVSSTNPGPPTTAGGIAFIVWGLVGLACGAVCVLAARAVLFALPLPPLLLRAAFGAALVVTAAMVGIVAAAGLYAFVLWTDGSTLSSAPNGPLQLVSVGASLIIQLVVMGAAAAAATVSIRRGWQAIQHLPESGTC